MGKKTHGIVSSPGFSLSPFVFLTVLSMLLPSYLKTRISYWGFNKSILITCYFLPFFPYLFEFHTETSFFSFEAIHVKLWEAYVSSNTFFFLWESLLLSIVLKCVFLCNGVNFSCMGITCNYVCKGGKAATEVWLWLYKFSVCIVIYTYAQCLTICSRVRKCLSGL